MVGMSGILLRVFATMAGFGVGTLLCLAWAEGPWLGSAATAFVGVAGLIATVVYRLES